MNISTEEILLHLGITDLNGMQQESLSAFRKSRNVVLLSPTGTGKTLAYLIPLVQQLDVTSDAVQAVVLVPSRELAMQTQSVIKQMGTPVRSVAVYGGRPAMDEHRTIRGVMPHIIVGTPGRMLDHLQKENFSSHAVSTLVIDEFDKCLELGFQDEMQNVLQHLPAVQNHTLLSATDCPQIPQFVGTDERSLVRLDFLDGEDQVPDRISIHQVHSAQKDKLEVTGRLLRTLGAQSTLVFVGFRESVERIAKYLRDEGFAVSAFHGGMDQKDRERALYRFVGGAANIMVSTDLAARGLDIPALDNVIHYHLPMDEQAYIHRNGRTGRWDATGNAWMIIGPEEHLPEFVQSEPEMWKCPSRLPSPAQPLWNTIYIGKGKKDKLSKGDIAGFLMKVGGLAKDEVGRIDVRDHYSYVSISRKRVKDTLIKLRGQKIKGLKTIFEPTK